MAMHLPERAGWRYEAKRQPVLSLCDGVQRNFQPLSKLKIADMAAFTLEIFEVFAMRSDNPLLLEKPKCP